MKSKDSVKEVKRDKKAQQVVEDKRAAAKAAVPAIREALMKFRKQPAT